MERVHDTDHYLTIDELLSNPLTAGYLLIFCQSQYNSENLNFIMEVDDYRDQFLGDRDLWKSVRWKDIDTSMSSSTAVTATTDHDISSSSWVSVADKVTIEGIMNEIYDRYLCDDSSTQVGSSKEIQQRTRQRMKHVHLYGPYVFDEACLDPIKTMKKDILPRFLLSNVYRRMVQDVTMCEPPPPASDLKVPPPGCRLLTNASMDHFHDSRRFTLEEIIGCLQLYNVFLAFLRRRVCAENLICVPMIAIFEDQMHEDELVEGQATALKIYRYFVAPGSAFEVSLQHAKRKHVMRDIAQPKPHIFEFVRRSAYDQLKIHFEQFLQTPDYAHLSELMRNAKLELTQVQYSSGPSPRSGGGGHGGINCFGAGK